MNIEYMEPDILKKRLRSLVRLDEAMTPPEKDWLRIWTSGISDDGVRWYMLDNGGGNSIIYYISSPDDETMYNAGFEELHYGLWGKN